MRKVLGMLVLFLCFSLKTNAHEKLDSIPNGTFLTGILENKMVFVSAKVRHKKVEIQRDLSDKKTYVILLKKPWHRKKTVCVTYFEDSWYRNPYCEVSNKEIASVFAGVKLLLENPRVKMIQM